MGSWGGSGIMGSVSVSLLKKRRVPVICFESEIDRLVYPLYGLMEDKIKIVERKE
jgi:hypothetical protein